MRIEIPLKLPSLNDYVRACRANKYGGAKMKKDTEEAIGWFIKSLPRFESPVTISFHWIEANKRRDYDNIAFGKKFILDALVKYGKLKDDNRRFVTGFADTFQYGEKTAVIINIERTE
jgi:Holliday junction resolvase RusA-like endonuclease